MTAACVAVNLLLHQSGGLINKIYENAFCKQFYLMINFNVFIRVLGSLVMSLCNDQEVPYLIPGCDDGELLLIGYFWVIPH